MTATARMFMTINRLKAKKSNEWLMQKYYTLEDEITLLNKTFTLKDLYRNVDFS